MIEPVIEPFGSDVGSQHKPFCQSDIRAQTRNVGCRDIGSVDQRNPKHSTQHRQDPKIYPPAVLYD